MASSKWLGSRPSSRAMAAASSSVSPKARWIDVSMATRLPVLVLPTNSCAILLHMTTKGKPAKTPMSQAHKEALAIGREEGRAVRRYLEALEAHRPKRGRKRSQETIQKQ